MGSWKGLRGFQRLPGDEGEKRATSNYGRYLVWFWLLLLGTSLYFIDYANQIYSPHHSNIQVQIQKIVGKLNEVSTERPRLHNTPSGFDVNDPGCRIPAMDPFDPLVKKYIKILPPIDCSDSFNHTLQLVASNLTAIFIVQEALVERNISDVSALECCYRPFWRVDGNISSYSYGVDDKIEFAKNCTWFESEATIVDEFVQVVCQMDGKEVYTDYHAFTPLKEDVERRCMQMSSLDEEVEGVSVLVLGIDAVSRLNFHRQMPRTAALLKEMEAVEMLGYNKIGDNTFPNLVSVLSGNTEEELQQICWPNTKSSFDNCNFLWNNFSEAGYRTGYGEDAPWMGIFSYLKVGFVMKPTDYYMRPYSKLYEDKCGHNKPMNAKLCIGTRLTVEVLLQYASKFAVSMTSRRSFGLFWGASLTHDYLNMPRLGDALYESVLRRLLSSEAMKRTVLVLMSDHGIRWGPIRETYQGRLEERLPLLSFIFPPWFRDDYSEAVVNLRRNTQRLTTPFDLHYTLNEFMNLSQLTQPSIRRRTRELEAQKPRPRGSSLFLPVSNQRTCQEAGIAPHWCTCQESKALPTDSHVAIQMANFLVHYLNTMLLSLPQCSALQLSSVHDARLQYPVEHISNYTKEDTLLDYVVVVETIPGNGVFEATIRQQTAKNMSVTGTVSRINTYGEQSACVADYHMKLYCYCA